MRAIATILFSLVFPGFAVAAEVLVLGTYHMANPSQDLFNVRSDDVLAAKRQAEIAAVVSALKKFQPTKIAVERDVGDKRLPKDYADYVAGRHELTRNEIEQIGFRLAKELGHSSIYPVDADGEFPYQRLVNYAKASGRSRELENVMAEFGADVAAQDQYLASHTILETLLSMNSDESAARSVGLYYRLARLGEPGDWAGPDLVADWFRRNARIYGNVAQLAGGPQERVLVIFGVGHLGWLQWQLANDSTIRLRKLAQIVGQH